MSGPALTRRRLLAGAGAAGMALAAAGGGAALARRGGDGEPGVIAFHGPHQAGITTPVQEHLVLAAFDLADADRAGLGALMAEWTAAAARMAAGEPVGTDADALAPPADTGEATGHDAARLTVTFGFGPSLFGPGRGFGLGPARPAALDPLPPFPRDAIDPARSDGDLCVQACADDLQVAFHAVRNLTRIGRGRATLRWTQTGFAGSLPDGGTPRNLMGFRDGTANLDTADRALMDTNVWVSPEDGPAWMAGGTYMVVRRVRILVEAWDRASLVEQERVVGRHKATGAPIGARAEFDPVDTARMDPSAHVRLANPRTAASGAERILRRGYSYADGIDPRLGQLDAGLVFIAFQRDPRTQFVPIQRRLAASDGMGEYLSHTASALFACPPGAAPGDAVGAALLA